MVRTCLDNFGTSRHILKIIFHPFPLLSTSAFWMRNEISDEWDHLQCCHQQLWDPLPQRCWLKQSQRQSFPTYLRSKPAIHQLEFVSLPFTFEFARWYMEYIACMKVSCRGMWMLDDVGALASPGHHQVLERNESLPHQRMEKRYPLVN